MLFSFFFFPYGGKFLYTWREKSSPHVAFFTWLLPFNLVPANKRKSIFQGPSTDRKFFFRPLAGARSHIEEVERHPLFGEREKQPLRELFSIAAGGNKVQARCGAGQEPGSAACTEGRCRSADFGIIPPKCVGHSTQSSMGGKGIDREATDSQSHICKSSIRKRVRNSLQEGS